jgi:DNA-binding MarR family transcriptional regulator
MPKPQNLNPNSSDNNHRLSDDVISPLEETHYVLEDQVGFILRGVSQRHLSLFSRLIPDLTPTQFSALSKLCQLGQASQNELGRLTAMDAATIKGVVDRLKLRELISSEPLSSDLRRLILKPTSAGRQLYNEVVMAAHAVTKDTLEPLSDKEKEVFLDLLKKLT